MIWKGNGVIQMEEGEPALRSCWECNGAHEHLKTVNWLHVCYSCGRYWVFDRFLDALETDADFDSFMQSKGLQVGDSTTKIDAGYRIYKISLAPREASNGP